MTSYLVPHPCLLHARRRPHSGGGQERYFTAALAAQGLEMKQWYTAELDKRDDALRREFNIGQKACGAGIL